MYEAYWNLERKPFENTPDPGTFWLSPEHSEALDRFAELIRERRGAGLLTGEQGCGKTTMVKVLHDRLDLDQHRVAYLNYPRIGPEELFGEILRRLGEDAEGDNVARMHRLGEVFFRTAREGAHSLVIVDDAQIIPDDLTLDELRLLRNFRLDGAPLVTLLLIGDTGLRERVVGLPALDQRIDVRYHLRGFDRDQTGSYVAYRMEAAGAGRAVFTDDAVDAIHEHASGNPRSINGLCDMCLFVGARRGVESIDANLVRKVA